MSIKAEVMELFDRQHAITSECLRRFEAGQPVDDLKLKEEEIQTRLKSILDEGLKGEFSLKDFRIEKDHAYVTISNGTFVIPCNVRYKRVGLKSFGRKPGSKQISKRIEELQRCLKTQELLDSNHYVVGTSYLEAQEGGYFIMCRQIEIVA